MFQRFLGRGRVRAALKRVAADPTAENYIELAQCHANAGELADVATVCDEGLALYPHQTELERLRERATSLVREDRVRDLQRELKHSPRPALWRELCEVQIESGRVSRAESVAAEWFESTGDHEALYYRAKARSERYFADRRRDDARVALDLIDVILREKSSDERAIRVSLSIYSRCGAWSDARTLLARLLELCPGEPNLEARFRTVAALSENAPSLDQALREVERTGKFVDDDNESERAESSQKIRPLLQEISNRPGVEAAFYVRGGTALVQGLRGASAERYARGVRELVALTRSSCRRLGLGQPLDIQFEGDFGTLSIRPGSLGAAAIWTSGPHTARTSEALSNLVGNEKNAKAVGQ